MSLYKQTNVHGVARSGPEDDGVVAGNGHREHHVPGLRHDRRGHLLELGTERK